ncbi:MAG: hypothetical protein AAFY71_26180 [Bacteroidota bacterium]
MKTLSFIKILSFGFILLLFTSCAGTYNSVRPDSYNYGATEFGDGLEINYKHAILKEAGNKKYAKKEDKKDIKLIGVRLKNFTSRTISVANEVEFFVGGQAVNPLMPEVTHKLIKQRSASHLLYLLLTPMVATVGESGDIPLGLVVAPGLAIGNGLVARNSNKKLLAELEDYNLLNKEIAPGETIYGILAVRDVGYDPVQVKLR